MKLISAALTFSIFLGVLAVGMSVARGDLTCVLNKPSKLVRSLLAMNILGPIVTVLVCRLFSLHPAVIIGLVTLSIAPVGALFPQVMLPLVAPGNAAYARGLFFASTVFSVILTPLAVEVFNALYGAQVRVSPLAVAQVVVGSVLFPLGVGLGVGRWWPAAKRWIPAIHKGSMIVLVVCLLAIVVFAWPKIGLLLRFGTLTALILVTLIGLGVGYFLGGPDEDDRTVLACATVSRHPGVAIAVASLTDQPLAPVGVLLAALVGALASVPYKRHRKKQKKQGTVLNNSIT